MPFEVGAVTAACQFLLEGIRNAAVANTIILPERQYVTTGGAVYDCAQVTVSANTMATGLAGAEQGGMIGMVGGCDGSWNVSCELAIVRCGNEQLQVGTRINVPSVEDIEADTAVSSGDAAVLVAAIEAAAGPGAAQAGMIPITVQFGEVAGGLTAVVASVVLNLWDFPAPPVDP